MGICNFKVLFHSFTLTSSLLFFMQTTCSSLPSFFSWISSSFSDLKNEGLALIFALSYHFSYMPAVVCNTEYRWNLALLLYQLLPQFLVIILWQVSYCNMRGRSMKKWSRLIRCWSDHHCRDDSFSDHLYQSFLLQLEYVLFW